MLIPHFPYNGIPVCLSQPLQAADYWIFFPLFFPVWSNLDYYWVNCSGRSFFISTVFSPGLPTPDGILTSPTMVPLTLRPTCFFSVVLWSPNLTNWFFFPSNQCPTVYTMFRRVTFTFPSPPISFATPTVLCFFAYALVSVFLFSLSTWLNTGLTL